MSASRIDLPPLPSGADLPSVAELLEDAVAVALPMRTRFRRTTVREALLLRGPQGWAEFSPFPEYGPQESSRWLAAAVEAGWHGWPRPVRDAVPVNATVPAIPAAQVGAVLERFGAVSAVKVKVAEAVPTAPHATWRAGGGEGGGGQPGARGVEGVHGVEADLARVSEVHRLLPDAAVRIDANAGWDQDTALEALRRLAQTVQLEYAEQPVAGIDGLARLRAALAEQGIAVRIAADESVRREEDPLAVAQAGAADLIVVKVQPLGGVRRALAIVQSTGLDAVVSSALDTSVGIAGGVALAAALPRLPHACGLGTVALFEQDVVSPAWTPQGGRLAVGERPVPDPALLRRLRAPGQAQQRWRDRLTAAHAVLAEA